jgi:hypothetical protein
MSELIPIPGREWITRKAGKRLRKMYPNTRIQLLSLPLGDIEPEWFCKNHQYDVEYMLALLQVGAWVEYDWKTLVRYTIAKRLKVRASALFPEPFTSMQEQVLEYQLQGGTYRVRDAIRKKGVSVWNHPLATSQQQAVAKLLLSITDERTENALIQPFHWIRAAVGLSEDNHVFSLGLVRSEMARQKVTLTSFLRAQATLESQDSDPEIL